MVVDLSQFSDKEMTVFDIQEIFSSPQSNNQKLTVPIDHECECPFCLEISHLILSASLLIGT